MAELIWTEPALDDLNDIAEYIALDNPDAATKLVLDVFDKVDRLEEYPTSGKSVAEMPGTNYRELVIPPCRIFYRPETDFVYVLFVMRGEQLFREFLLKGRHAEQ